MGKHICNFVWKLQENIAPLGDGPKNNKVYLMEEGRTSRKHDFISTYHVSPK